MTKVAMLALLVLVTVSSCKKDQKGVTRNKANEQGPNFNTAMSPDIMNLDYPNRFFNRYKNRVQDVTYTDRNNRTFVNKHYDLQWSLYFSVLYRF